jgi:hypothetical protein
VISLELIERVMNRNAITLPPEFQKDAARFRFEAKELPGGASVHQWRTIIELVTIQNL